MASVAGSHITNRCYRSKLQGLRIVHERTKTSNRLRRDGEMTIAITGNANQYQINFRPAGLLRLVLQPQPPLPSFYCCNAPRRPPAHGPHQDPGEQESRTLTSRASNILLSASSAINLAWNGAETTRSFRFPPWQGTSEGQRGVRVDLRSRSPCVLAEARPARLSLPACWTPHV